MNRHGESLTMAICVHFLSNSLREPHGISPGLHQASQRSGTAPGYGYIKQKEATTITVVASTRLLTLL